MPPRVLNLRRIDTRRGDVGPLLKELRAKLSPEGDVVSEAGRRRTIAVFGEALTPVQVVDRIYHDLRARGLDALLHYGQVLDGAELTAESLRVPAEQLAAAHAAADPAFLAAVRRVRENIFEFQTAILHEDVELLRPNGVVLRQRYLPLERAGLCVPGGAAAYPSTVLMTAVPAQAAGVPQLAIAAPPTPFGADNPDVRAVCHELGITELYRMGGAQGVIALALGAGPIAPVDKIVGPGNLFVQLAKKLVYGRVDIDSLAGPSEVIVLADATTPAAFIAADLLAQAEHAPGSSILITWEADILDTVAAELDRQVAELERCEVTIESLEAFGAFILARDEKHACELTNLFAPEHLHVAVEEPERLLPQLRHAGAIFLGSYTPVAVGDYIAGPSHTLPTGGTARWAAGLSANDFLRAGSVIAYPEEALRAAAGDLRCLAEKEGLTAHRASVDIRLGNRS